MTRRLLVWLWLAALMTGCATQLTQPEEGVSGSHQPALLLQLQHWALDGKLAVTAGQERQSAQFRWVQQGDTYDLRLSGPAGLKATRLHGRPGDVVLEQADRREQANNAEALSQRLIGWPLPASSFQYWLKGLPAPDSLPERTQYAPTGLLKELVQGGWTLRFSQYQQHGAIQLPGRIEADHDNVHVILLAKQWQPFP